MMDPTTLLKIAGALLAFALGIWIGLGTPGLRRRTAAGNWRASDRLRATWINRMFFRMESPPRRFGTDLIAPGDRRDKSGQATESEAGAGEGVGGGEGGETPSLVRLRRSGER